MPFILNKVVLKVKILHTNAYSIEGHIYISSRIMALMLTGVTTCPPGTVTKHVTPCQPKIKMATNLS